MSRGLALGMALSCGTLSTWATEAQRQAGPDSVNVDDVLTRWEAIRDPGSLEALSECASVVREALEKGDQSILPRLLDITKNELQPLSSRSQALTVACELADPEGATKIVEAMKSQMADTRAVRQGEWDEESKAKVRDGVALLQHFLVQPARLLLDDLHDHQEILSLASEAYLGGVRSSVAGPAAARLISECRVSQEVMDTKIVQIVVGSRGGAVPEFLVDRISPAAFAQLREAVRSDKTPRGFHYAAARALSHLGDEEIMGDLKALRPAFREYSDSAEKHLLNFLWRIEVQHPPDKLLDYIASTDLRGFRAGRRWAVRRAHRLAVQPERIREAILMHERNAPSTRIGHAQLLDLKLVGLDLEILRESDLSDVDVLGRKPTP